MVYNKLIKVMINTPGLSKVIFDIVVRYPGISDSIISN